MQAAVLYAYCGNNPILFKDFAGYAEYYIDGETPEFQFDHTFPYDSSKKAKFADYLSYAKWRSLGFGSNFAPWLEDASKAYNHYLNGTGTDLKIDYEKAYKEDSYIKACIDSEIEVIKTKIIEIYDNDNAQTSFEMTGEIFGIQNGTTENWQKTIGAHQVYADAKVSINPETNVADVTITFHMEDMYNFNPGMQDIATGTPDDVNGRFSELGWAKEFKTYGSMEKVISWNLKDGSVVSNNRGGVDR